MRYTNKPKSKFNLSLIFRLTPYLLGIFLLISSYLFFQTGTGPLSFLSKKTEINAVGSKCKVEKDEYMECTDPNGKKTVTTYTNGHVSNISTTSTIVERDPEKGVVGRTTVVNSRDTTYNGSTGTYVNATGGTNTTVIQETKYKKKDDGEVEEEKSEIVTRVIQNNNTPQETVTITVKDKTGTVKQEQTFKTGAGEVPKLASTPAAAKLPSGKGSCATSGNPIQEGTWAATGTYSDNGSPSPETALCKQCGADGSFSGETKACLTVVGTAPIVLPSHMEVVKTKDGKEIPFKKCFAKVDGAYMQVAPGEEVKGEDSTKYCSPEGKLVDSKDEALQIICSLNGQIASGGKCADKPQTPAAPPASGSNPGKLSGIELAAAIRDCTSSPNKAGETSYFDNTTGQCLTKKSADACKDRASKENKAGSVVWYTCNGDKTTITTCLEGSYAADGTCVRKVVPTGIKDQLPTICVYPRIPKLDASGKGACELAPTNFGAAPPANSTTPLLITDNSNSRNIPVGAKCGEGSVFFGLVGISGPNCQLGCEGGVFTHVRYGTLSTSHAYICGEQSDPQVVDTVKTLSLSERNVRIIEDSSTSQTTKKLSECSRDGKDSPNCLSCEGGLFTTVETGGETSRFCGSKDEVSGMLNNNPSLISSPTTPNNTSVNSDSELEDKILNRNGRVNAIVQGPGQCKYEGGEYIGWFKYRCPGEDGTLSSNDQPYCSSEVSDQCDGQSNAKCSPTKDGGKCVDMNGVDIVLDVVSPEVVVDTVGNTAQNTGNSIGNFFSNAWSQIVGTFTNIGNDTVEVVDYAATLDDPADPPVRPTKPAANPGTVKLKGECFVHSDCEPGLHCKTTWGNLQTSTCAKSSTEIVEKGVVGQGGKLSVGTPCYDDDQCESGAVCNKSVFADTCKPKDVPAGGSIVEDKDQKYKKLPTGAGVYSYTKDGIVYIILPAGYTEQNLKDLNNSATEKE